MNVFRLLSICGLAAAASARAVYAPLPEPELAKDWTVTLRAGVSHDSNIFGSEQGAIGSTVYTASPRIAFNGSLSDQTFAAAGYTLTVDHFDRRPGKKSLDSHELSARIAHAFGPATNLDVSDAYQISRNPESLLSGVPVNTDQSFKRNELNGRLVFAPAPKFSGTVKLRSVNYRYDNPVLGRNIDRFENLYGLAGSYDVVPELKAVAEYRHEDIYYRKLGETKNKRTDFLLGGLDYALAKKVSISTRLGGEWRDRSSEQSTTSPYAEISARYDYAQRSFLTAGYVYTHEETSNIAVFNDTQVNRLFLNVQQAVSPLVVASTSITYEPSQLQGRRGQADEDETTTRLGFALTWLPNTHWSASLSYDYDQVSSDVPGRDQNRTRYGISGSYMF